jgi:hypothetical protein
MVVAVGQCEQPFAPVRRTNLGRREYSRRNAETHSAKLVADFTEPEGQMAGDVLEKSEVCAALVEDAADMRPEMARIVRAASLAGVAERLARIARSDAIHDSAPRFTVEGGEVRPDRSWSQR